MWIAPEQSERVNTEPVCVCVCKQKTTLFPVHLLGAILTFGIGALYVLIQTLLSLKMQPHIHSKTVYQARLGIGVWTLCSIISSILQGGNRVGSSRFLTNVLILHDICGMDDSKDY